MNTCDLCHKIIEGSNAKARTFCSRTCYFTSRSIPAEDRFWDKVNKDGPIPEHVPHLGPCWIWTKGLRRGGYGQFHSPSGHHGAHQFAWEIENGPIPEGLCVLHKCDVRACVRNDGENGHLFVGTKKQNTQDMISKRRYGAITRPDRVARGERNGSVRYPGIRAGEKNGRAKLTWDMVTEIRERHDRNEASQSAMAREYNVSASLINQIVLRQIWTEAQ